MTRTLGAKRLNIDSALGSRRLVREERPARRDRSRAWAQARQWYEKAVAAGSAEAMDNLGAFYQYGLGGKQDYTQARQWYEKAAAGGNADAQAHLKTFPK